MIVMIKIIIITITSLTARLSLPLQAFLSEGWVSVRPSTRQSMPIILFRFLRMDMATSSFGIECLDFLQPTITTFIPVPSESVEYLWATPATPQHQACEKPTRLLAWAHDRMPFPDPQGPCTVSCWWHGTFVRWIWCFCVSSRHEAKLHVIDAHFLSYDVFSHLLSSLHVLV